MSVQICCYFGIIIAYNGVRKHHSAETAIIVTHFTFPLKWILSFSYLIRWLPGRAKRRRLVPDRQRCLTFS